MKSFSISLIFILCCSTLVFSLNPSSFIRSSAITLSQIAAASPSSSPSSSSSPSWDAQLAPMLSPQAYLSPYSLAGAIYCPGGLSTSPDHPYAFSLLLQRYSPSQDAWSFLPPIPSPFAASLPVVAPSPSSFSPPSLFYLNDPAAILAFNASAAAWSARPWPAQRPPVLVRPSVVASQHLVYLIGGLPVGNATASSQMWTFDPSEWRFQLAPGALPKGRFAIHSCTDGASIYAVGGIDTDEQTYNFVDIYDLQAQSWSVSRSASLPFFPGSNGVQVQGVACTGGLVYVFYGMNLVQTFNPVTQAWAILSPAPVVPAVGVGFGTTTFQDKIFVIGGFSPSQTISNSTWQFNP